MPKCFQRLLAGPKRFWNSYQKNDRSEIKVAPPGLDRDNFSWRTLWYFVGPGFLISIAYIDPGNLTTDIVSGARFNFTLLWIILVATFLGFVVQFLSHRLGTVSGYHLAELCRHEYGEKTPLTIVVWLLTELAVIAADVPQILGAAFAWNILSYNAIPLWAGVLISTIDTLVLMGIQYFGVRYLEAFVSLLVLAISICFFVQLGLTTVPWTSAQCPGPGQWCSSFPDGICPDGYQNNYCGIVWSGFVPYLDSTMIFIALSLFGAVVMPHNLYLHSGLALTRQVDITSYVQKKWACIYGSIELAVSLFISILINLAVIIVAATMFYPSFSNHFQTSVGDDIGFETATRLLEKTLGKAAAVLFGIALWASAHSSTITGTYAAQFIMHGFLNLRIAPWKRNLLTRSVAIIPSFAVSLAAGKSGSTLLIMISSMIMSVQLPFALVPLLKFTSSSVIMGKDFVNPLWLTISCCILCFGVVLANFYAVLDTLFFSGSLKGAALIVVIIVMSLAGLGYLGLLIYLVFRKIKPERHISEFPFFTEKLEVDYKEGGNGFSKSAEVITEKLVMEIASSKSEMSIREKNFNSRHASTYSTSEESNVLINDDESDEKPV